jgi:hypothetical protein
MLLSETTLHIPADESSLPWVLHVESSLPVQVCGPGGS